MNLKPPAPPKPKAERVDWKKLIHFDEHFHKVKLPLDADKGSSSKAGMSAKALADPFGNPNEASKEKKKGSSDTDKKRRAK